MLISIQSCILASNRTESTWNMKMLQDPIVNISQQSQEKRAHWDISTFLDSQSFCPALEGCFKSLWKTKHNQLFTLASPSVHCVAFRTEPPEAVLKRGHVNRFSKGFTEACGKQRAQRVCQANRNKYSGIGSFNWMKYDNLPKMKCLSACPCVCVCVYERLIQSAFLLTVVLNWLAMTQK